MPYTVNNFRISDKVNNSLKIWLSQLMKEYMNE